MAKKKEIEDKKVKKNANGEGTINQKPNGRFEMQITVGTNPITGMPKRKSFSGRTKGEVRAKRREYDAAVANGTYCEPTKLTVGEWLGYWLKEFKYRYVEPSSYDFYESKVRVHLIPNIGSVRLQELNTLQIQSMINILVMKLSATTIQNIHLTLNQALEKAVDIGYISKNPAKQCTLPKKKKDKKYKAFKQEEISKIMKSINYDNSFGVIVMLAFATGLREGEILALTWEDFDFENKCVSINKALSHIKVRDEIGEPIKVDNKNIGQLIVKQPKTESSIRVMPLPANIIPILKKHKLKTAEINLRNGIPVNDENLAFPTSKGTKIYPNNLCVQWKRFLKRAGVNYLTFHSIRHTYTTILTEKGGSIKTIQELLGHSSISTTLDIYTHVSGDLKKSTVSKLNDIFTNLEASEDGNKVEETEAKFNNPAS